MAAYETTFVNAVAGAIKEVLPQSMHVDLMASDPIYDNMVLGSSGLVPVGELGRDYRYRRRFHTSTGGVIRGGNLNDYKKTLYGENATQINRTADNSGGARTPGKLLSQELAGTWPDPTQGVVTDDWGVTFDLYTFEFNLMLTLAEMTADKVPATIREFTSKKIRGLSRRIALYFADSFYQDSTNKLGTFPATVAAGDIDANNHTIILRPTELTTHRFMVGQEVDIWPSTFPGSGERLNQQTSGSPDSTDPSHRARAFVIAVNDVTGYVQLWVENSPVFGGGTFTWATVFTTVTLASAYVTPANTYGGTSPKFAKFFGYNDFFKHAATTAQADTHILGDNAITSTSLDYIDVRDHPEFYSWYKNVNGQLTISALAAYLDAVELAFSRSGDTIDELIACRGAWRNMVEQDEARLSIETQGMPSSLQGRGSNIGSTFVVDGRVYTRRTSNYLQDGRIIGVRKSGNWQFAVPPDPDMARRGGLPDMPDKIPVNFIIPALTGGAMQTFPILRADGATGNSMPTEACMMPGMVRAQMFPRNQIRGMILDGVTTTREFGA
jgi:hypothetical protein